jgi:hypothetical protein
MTRKKTYNLITLLIPLLVLICLPAIGAETSSHDVVVRILSYSEADLTRQVPVEHLPSFVMNESTELPFFSNDLLSKRITIVTSYPSVSGFSRDMEFEITKIGDFITLFSQIKPENSPDDLFEITYTITDL